MLQPAKPGQPPLPAVNTAAQQHPQHAQFSRQGQRRQPRHPGQRHCHTLPAVATTLPSCTGTERAPGENATWLYSSSYFS